MSRFFFAKVHTASHYFALWRLTLHPSALLRIESHYFTVLHCFALFRNMPHSFAAFGCTSQYFAVVRISLCFAVCRIMSHDAAVSRNCYQNLVFP